MQRLARVRSDMFTAWGCKFAEMMPPKIMLLRPMKRLAHAKAFSGFRKVSFRGASKRPVFPRPLPQLTGWLNLPDGKSQYREIP